MNKEVLLHNLGIEKNGQYPTINLEYSQISQYSKYWANRHWNALLQTSDSYKKQIR